MPFKVPRVAALSFAALGSATRGAFFFPFRSLILVLAFPLVTGIRLNRSYENPFSHAPRREFFPATPFQSEVSNSCLAFLNDSNAQPPSSTHFNLFIVPQAR